MSLSDINHFWGQDLQLSPTGDLGLVSGTQRGQQRLLRRFLTNPGGYVFQSPYGGGVLAAIGNPENQGTLVSVLRSQALMEDSVAQRPPPTVSVNPAQTDTAVGAIAVSVAYTDTPSNAPTVLAFTASS